MSTPTYESGFGGDATINAKLYSVISWSGQFPATLLEYMNSKVGNHPITLATYTRANVTIELDYSQADQPFQSSQGALVPGTAVTNVILLCSTTSNDCWTITSMIVANTPMSLQRAGKITTSLQLQINGGTITPPGGSQY
jgi:hypothetical protein